MTYNYRSLPHRKSVVLTLTRGSIVTSVKITGPHLSIPTMIGLIASTSTYFETCPSCLSAESMPNVIRRYTIALTDDVALKTPSVGYRFLHNYVQTIWRLNTNVTTTSTAARWLGRIPRILVVPCHVITCKMTSVNHNKIFDLNPPSPHIY